MKISMLTLSPIVLPGYQFLCFYDISGPWSCGGLFSFLNTSCPKIMLFFFFFYGVLSFLGWGLYGPQRFLEYLMGQIFCNKLFEGERKIFSGGFGCLFTMLLMSLVSLTIMEIAPYTILFKPSMFWLLLISVSVCSTFVISSFVNSPSVFMCSYIVPEQPFFLYLFLIPIEVFSSMLRPLTVALRMALNLTAGVILIKFAWCAGLSFLESTYTGLEEVFVFSSVLHFAVYVFIASLCLFAFCYIAVFEFLAMILHVFIYCMMIRVYELGHGEKL